MAGGGSSKIVLSYHDSLLREEDVELLEPPNWLNDKIIGFYFEYLEKDVFNGYADRVCFITPDVTQFIKLYTGSEVAMFLEPLCLSTKDIVILAVNSNSSKTAAGGSHCNLFYSFQNYRSTLVYNRANNRFEHYDSSGSSNRQEALKCCSSLTEFIKAPCKPDLVEAGCSKQDNSYDCGVFCVMFAEHVTKERLGLNQQSLKECVTKETVCLWREETEILIQDLRKRLS